MNIGPKMTFILRVYQMSEVENAEDIERDRAIFQSGGISKRDFELRDRTREVARYYRHRDDAAGPPWPRQWNGRRKRQPQRPNIFDIGPSMTKH
jgi:hypothetical protein